MRIFVFATKKDIDVEEHVGKFMIKRGKARQQGVTEKETKAKKGEKE